MGETSVRRTSPNTPNQDELALELTEMARVINLRLEQIRRLKRTGARIPPRLDRELRLIGAVQVRIQAIADRLVVEGEPPIDGVDTERF